MGLAMNNLFNGIYAGKKVLVTGHTGFKGSWLSIWLRAMGAQVVGYALPPDTKPSMFEVTGLHNHLVHMEGDVRDYEHLSRVVLEHRPDMVFHLAAQPLVRLSYQQPRYTFETNIMGTVNLLEALRASDTVRVCTVITSDKCYENHEWDYSYRENDALGGYDPYSSSKAGAELAISAYRRSFFNNDSTQAAIASARAGNVIGGGDWALDRLVTDAIKSLVAGEPIPVRNPDAVRPWQFVLEPLSGYLWLAARLWQQGDELASGWNFGPNDDVIMNVGEIATRLAGQWGSGTWQDRSDSSLSAPHEANYLQLDCSKARRLLDWFPVYSIEQAIDATVAWYKNYYRPAGDDAYDLTLAQINDYVRQAQVKRVKWAGRIDTNEC